MQSRTGPLYRLGASLGFDPAGGGNKLLSNGWSQPDPSGFVWSDGPDALLLFSIATPARDVTCQMEVMPFIVPSVVDMQRLEVFFNHFRVGYAELREGRQTVDVYLPKELFILRIAALNLHLPDCRSPTELGLSTDRRRLGLALWSLQISPVS